jgi:hypothetical protein
MWFQNAYDTLLVTKIPGSWILKNTDDGRASAKLLENVEDSILDSR